MGYSTDLMNQILKSPTAQKIVQGLTPKYGEAYAILWLFQVIGTQLDKLQKWISWDETEITSIKAQVVPQTATWSLPIWEDAYNIVPSPEWDLDRRRQNIVNRKWQRAPMNPYKVEQILAVATGCDVRIVERTGRNRFSVYISSMPVDVEQVKNQLNEIKPAHLIYNVTFEQYTTCELYVGCMLHASKVISLRRV